MTIVEAAGVGLFRRTENKQVIEKLGNPKTLDAHDWAFHCTRIAHTKKMRLSPRSAFRKSFLNRRTIPDRSRAPIVWMDKSREGTDCSLLADHRSDRLGFRDYVWVGDFTLTIALNADIDSLGEAMPRQGRITSPTRSRSVAKSC